MVVVGILVISNDVCHERNCCERVSWTSMENSKSSNRISTIYIYIYMYDEIIYVY